MLAFGLARQQVKDVLLPRIADVNPYTRAVVVVDSTIAEMDAVTPQMTSLRQQLRLKWFFFFAPKVKREGDER